MVLDILILAFLLVDLVWNRYMQQEVRTLKWQRKGLQQAVSRLEDRVQALERGYSLN